MKIAYLANYLDSSGYSQAARENILALDSIRAIVVPRAVRMTQNSSQIPERILELEKQDLNGVNVVIQHNLPDNFAYKSGVLNIGMFAYETDSFDNSNWKRNLELMDKVVVHCNSQKDAVLKTCGEQVHKKTYVLPHALNLKKADINVPLLNFGLNKNTKKFYTIAEYNHRKNFSALIAAFYTAFDYEDNVALIIKTSKGADKPLKSLIEELKRGCNRFKNLTRYPPIVIIADELPEEQIISIHKSCDVFVTASHGEAFCYPTQDAMLFGNHVIAPDCTAFIDYVKPIFGTVAGSYSSALGMASSPNGLYSSKENWFNINIQELAKAFKTNMVLALTKDEIKAEAIKFSRENIGKQLLEICSAN